MSEPIQLSVEPLRRSGDAVRAIKFDPPQFQGGTYTVTGLYHSLDLARALLNAKDNLEKWNAGAAAKMTFVADFIDQVSARIPQLDKQSADQIEAAMKPLTDNAPPQHR